MFRASATSPRAAPTDSSAATAFRAAARLGSIRSARLSAPNIRKPCAKGAGASISGLWAECLARKENYVEIDRDRVDAWGIPMLRINAEYRDNEKKLWQDGREQAAVMLEAAGAKNVRLTGESRARLLHP